MLKEEPLSLTGSRATPRYDRSSRPQGARTGPECSLFCERPLTLLHSRAGSLANNKLCGVYFDPRGHIQGTYTAEGFTVLCEGLKGSSVTSLK